MDDDYLKLIDTVKDCCKFDKEKTRDAISQGLKVFYGVETIDGTVVTFMIHKKEEEE